MLKTNTCRKGNAFKTGAFSYVFFSLKGLSHEKDLAFDDMYMYG